MAIFQGFSQWGSFIGPISKILCIFFLFSIFLYISVFGEERYKHKFRQNCNTEKGLFLKYLYPGSLFSISCPIQELNKRDQHQTHTYTCVHKILQLIYLNVNSSCPWVVKL